MKIQIRITFLLLFVATVVSAQRKEIGEARTILKSGKNVEKAEQLMTTLLRDSANQYNKRIYQLWLQSVQKQYAAANERMYLKQKQDTVQFFDLVSRMFTIAERLDSVEMLPDHKGRVNIEYRKENAGDLTVTRPNLFFGGTYHVRKGNDKKAYSFLEQYIGCAEQPLFSNYHFGTSDTRMPEAAYWATYAAYRMHDPVLTLRYRNMALQDSSKAEFTLQYIAEARSWLGDDSLYMETLREGFSRYPTAVYFFPRLLDYYTQHKAYDKALALADSALAVCDTCSLYLYAKATVLFSLQRYEESIRLADTLIARVGDAMPEAYYNAGTAYLNMALRYNPLREKKQLRKTYQKARPYMERYRQLAPEQRQKWGPALYRIYLNLNMGRQFDEIDQLLKK